MSIQERGRDNNQNPERCFSRKQVCCSGKGSDAIYRRAKRIRGPSLDDDAQVDGDVRESGFACHDYGRTASESRG